MKPTPTPTPEDPIRPHVFDGIQEYDKRLPNWWLNTLYITIVFWVGYWAYHEWLHLGQSDVQIVETAMAQIATERLSEAQARRRESLADEPERGVPSMPAKRSSTRTAPPVISPACGAKARAPSRSDRISRTRAGFTAASPPRFTSSS